MNFGELYFSYECVKHNISIFFCWNFRRKNMFDKYQAACLIKKIKTIKYYLLGLADVSYCGWQIKGMQIYLFFTEKYFFLRKGT
jgi:hypothetical protein